MLGDEYEYDEEADEQNKHQKRREERMALQVSDSNHQGDVQQNDVKVQHSCWNHSASYWELNKLANKYNSTHFHY